jgi:hypothetical protein
LVTEPDTDCLYGSVDAQAWKLVAGDNQLYLRPTGFLVSVVIELGRDEASMLAAVNFELTDTALVPLWATARKMSYRDCGGFYPPIIAMPLSEPLVNMSAANPYVLSAKSDGECTVRVMQLWHSVKRGF